MIIDAHHHLWDPARGDYGWLDPASPLHRPFTPEQFEAEARTIHVSAAIVVQAAPTAAEADYLLVLARAYPFLAGVVGWLDLSAPDVARQIREREREPLFVGVRPMLADLPDRDWILGPSAAAGLRALQESRLAFDALVNADQLSAVIILAMRYPNLRIILDHAGKPPFGEPLHYGQWKNAIARLAELPNVACKLSGLATELPSGMPISVLEGCIDLLIDLFGEDRLIWGSDWPVATLAIRYNDWLHLCINRVRDKAPHLAAGIFGENAQSHYRLNDQTSEQSRIRHD